MYYRNANCAVVVYDITQSSSLEKAKSWIRELQRQADPAIVIALCGNKTDLEARRQVTTEEAQKYAEEEGLLWFETSAKSGTGVSEVFTEIGASFLKFSALANRLIVLPLRSCSLKASQEFCSSGSSWRRVGCRTVTTRRGPQQASGRSGRRRSVQLLIRTTSQFALTSVSALIWPSLQSCS